MFRLIRQIFFVVMLAAQLVLPQAAAAQTTADSSAGSSQKTPEVVDVGVYLLAVYDMEHGANSYLMDFYLWFKWKGDIDPTKTIEFVNMVDRSSATVDAANKEPTILPDGSKYQLMKVEGRFTDVADFYSYPFDKHDISIRLEDSFYGSKDLVYRIDPESQFDPDLTVPGWHIDSLRTAVTEKFYKSTFGIDDPSTSYSKATFSLVIERPNAIFYWKLMLPLAFIIMAGLSSLVLPSSNIDARFALVGGALLTIVFLQKSYSDMLPDIDYLVLMDKIYVFAYIVTIAALIRVIYSFIKVRGMTEEGEAAVWKFDRSIFFGLVLLFAVASVYLVVVR